MQSGKNVGRHASNRKNNADPNTPPENERLMLNKIVSDFLQSGENETYLPNLSNLHRKYLHYYVAKLGLKSRSHGGERNRVLCLSRQKRRGQLDNVHKIDINPAARNLLQKSVSNMRAHLVNAHCLLKQGSRAQQRKHKRPNSECITIDLDLKMIPPAPLKISAELSRSKEGLPISQYKEQIHEMLNKHSVFILNGETGSGKTTQVPQYILEEATKNSVPCRVIVTQPRRVAAVSVSQRVAVERGEPLGHTVGYKIRMESCVRKTTNLIYTTSGCLLRSITADMKDLFKKTSHIIIDELHERDKSTDFTLISIKEQLQKNKNLKVILMSATMDIELLSRYFNNCPVLNVPGQGYNVKIFHLEDILFHTGYRTRLMDKYLPSVTQEQAMEQYGMQIKRKLEQQQEREHQQLQFLEWRENVQKLQQQVTALNSLKTNGHTNENNDNEKEENLEDIFESILDQCCLLDKKEEELTELFDQMLYYIECEEIPVDTSHKVTGLTPLMASCLRNCPKYVLLFMSKGADVHLQNTLNLSATDYASHHPDGVCTRIMLENNASLNEQQQREEQANIEKHRLLLAYQQQFNDHNEVDHDLIISLLEGLYRSSHPGAILVFLPGYSDIIQQSDLITSTFPAGTYKICILHGQMDSNDQLEALKKQRVRKIILSTNIGQTSITIPDLAYIIDSGKVKMKTFDAITESSQLESVWISKADANQRSGRAGRTQNGVCYRLYSSAVYQYMPPFSVPEFMRIPLTEICLYAKTLDEYADVQTYLLRSLNPPAPLSVQNAVRKLKLLEVFNEDESVTDLGKILVDIPLEVHLGKCLLYSIYLKCFEPILTIVSFHSIKDPFILPTDRNVQGHASFIRKNFSGEAFSDQMGILAMYKAYMRVRKNGKQLRDFCHKNFLSESTLNTFYITRKQIFEHISRRFYLGPEAKENCSDWNIIRLCLTAGLYPNLAMLDRNKISLVCGADNTLQIQRNSSLRPPNTKHLKEFIQKIPQDWIVFFEKSRLPTSNACLINMNTVISPLCVILQCGKICKLEENGSDESDLSDYDENGEPHQSDILHRLNALSIMDDREAIISIDGWIKFEMLSSDAKMLLVLRTLLNTYFKFFLNEGITEQNETAVLYVRELLKFYEKSVGLPKFW